MINFLKNNKKKLLLGFSILTTLFVLSILISALATGIPGIMELSETLQSYPSTSDEYYALLYNTYIYTIVDTVIFVVFAGIAFFVCLISVIKVLKDKNIRLNLVFMLIASLIGGMIAAYFTRIQVGLKEASSDAGFDMGSPSQVTAAMVCGYISFVICPLVAFIPTKINKWIRYAAFGVAYLILLISTGSFVSYFNTFKDLAIITTQSNIKLDGLLAVSAFSLLIALFGLIFSILFIIDESETKTNPFKKHKGIKISKGVEEDGVYINKKYDACERLKQIKELLDLDIISQEEFNEAKRKYLPYL